MSPNSRPPAVGRSGGSKIWLANGDRKDGRQMMAVQIGRPEPADHRPMTTSPFFRGRGGGTSKYLAWVLAPTNTRDIALQLLQHVRTTVQQKIADTAPAPDSYGFVPV